MCHGSWLSASRIASLIYYVLEVVVLTAGFNVILNNPKPEVDSAALRTLHRHHHAVAWWLRGLIFSSLWRVKSWVIG